MADLKTASVKMVDRVVPQKTVKEPDLKSLCEHITMMIARRYLAIGKDQNGVTGFIQHRMGPPLPNLVWVVCPICLIPCDVEQV